jgi:hypothetical protein
MNNRDLLAAMLVAAAGAGLALGPVRLPWLQALAAVPLVLFTPGYTLLAALLPGSRPGVIERALFSVGLSLAVTILGTVALDRTHWGLQPAAWAALLGGVTLAAGAAAWARRRRLPQAAAPWRVLAPIHGSQALLFSLAALAAIAAVTLAGRPAPARGAEGYSLLWLLPAADGNPNAARLGLSSHELAATEYRLALELDGRPIQEWGELSLAPGDRWEATAALPPARADEMLEARLYRADDPETIYRRVTLWRRAPGS